MYGCYLQHFASGEEAEQAVTNLKEKDFMGEILEVRLGTGEIIPPDISSPENPAPPVFNTSSTPNNAPPPHPPTFSSSSSSSSASSSKKVFVGNLPPGVNKMHLLDVFRKYGQIDNFNFLRSGVIFVSSLMILQSILTS